MYLFYWNITQIDCFLQFENKKELNTFLREYVRKWILKWHFRLLT